MLSLAGSLGEPKNTREIFGKRSISRLSRRRVGLCRDIRSLPSFPLPSRDHGASFSSFGHIDVIYALNCIARRDGDCIAMHRIKFRSAPARSFASFVSFDLSPLVLSSGTRITQPFRPWDRTRLARALGPSLPPRLGPRAPRLSSPPALHSHLLRGPFPPCSFPTPGSLSSLDLAIRVPRKRTRECLRCIYINSRNTHQCRADKYTIRFLSPSPLQTFRTTVCLSTFVL